jgi:hypothetical protein
MKKIIYHLFEKKYCQCECDCNYYIPASTAIGDIIFRLLKSFASGFFWFMFGFYPMWMICDQMLKSLGY